jgi:hypothetical protein
MTKAIAVRSPVVVPAIHDPAREINALIDKGRGEGPYSSRELAHQLVEQLRHDHPQLLQAWLEAQAEDLLWMVINRQDRMDRSSNRRSAERSVFSQAAGALSEPERRERLTSWLTTRYVTAEGLRVELGVMRRADLQYVAQRHRARATNSQLQADFMEALARKVGRGTVADHFDEEALTRMWASIVNS